MIQRISVELLVMACIGLILGLLGPFGTYAMPTALRLSYWIGFILVGYAIFRPITRVAGWLDDSTSIPFAAAITMAVAVASVPLSLLIGFAANGMTVEGPMLGSGFAILYLQCAGIGIAIFVLMRFIFPDEDRSQNHTATVRDLHPKTDVDPSVEISVKLHDRLPIGFPKKITALGVEDHYVRVHSVERSEMLLLRLRDAISEMDGIEGMQIHRSWWVARSAIMTSKRDGRNLRLILDCGLEVPVSRAYLAPLKQTGWI